LGDGPSKEIFQNSINKAGLKDDIILCGNIEHGKKFIDFISNSDFYILPNRDTGIGVGRSGWEMMARGLVCIFPPVAHRRHFIHKTNCLITTTGSPSDYFDCISYLIKNPHLIQQISLNASQTAFDNAVESSVDHIVNQIIRTIR